MVDWSWKGGLRGAKSLKTEAISDMDVLVVWLGEEVLDASDGDRVGMAEVRLDGTCIRRFMNI